MSERPEKYNQGRPWLFRPDSVTEYRNKADLYATTNPLNVPNAETSVPLQPVGQSSALTDEKPGSEQRREKRPETSPALIRLAEQRDQARAQVENALSLLEGEVTDEQRRELKAKVRMGERSAVRAEEGLILSIQPCAYRVAAKYFGKGLDEEEILGYASAGLANAVRKFDPMKGTLASLVSKHVHGEILHGLRDKYQAVRTPRPLYDVRVAAFRIRADLSNRTGRDPTTEQIAEALGVKPDEVDAALHDPRIQIPLSFDSEEITINDPRQIDHADKVTDTALLRSLLQMLTPEEREIVTLYYFGELTQAQIAKKVGLGQPQVSKILLNSVSSMKARVSETNR